MSWAKMCVCSVHCTVYESRNKKQYSPKRTNTHMQTGLINVYVLNRAYYFAFMTRAFICCFFRSFLLSYIFRNIFLFPEYMRVLFPSLAYFVVLYCFVCQALTIFFHFYHISIFSLFFFSPMCVSRVTHIHTLISFHFFPFHTCGTAVFLSLSFSEQFVLLVLC